MSKIIQEMRDNQLSQTALNFANTSKINRHTDVNVEFKATLHEQVRYSLSHSWTLR